MASFAVFSFMSPRRFIPFTGMVSTNMGKLKTFVVERLAVYFETNVLVNGEKNHFDFFNVPLNWGTNLHGAW